MKHDALIVPPGKKIRLKDFDPAYTGKYHSKEEALEKLETDIVRLSEYQTGSRLSLASSQGGSGAWAHRDFQSLAL
jgi:hypothetical protein